MSIIIALLIFSVIVIIHELGHFLLAKKNGIIVNEFSVGMGPRIFTIVKGKSGLHFMLFPSTKGDLENPDWEGRTLYSLKLLPIGGSCMMLGEDEEIENEGAFNKKGVWARISVVVAGPIFNFILAFFLAIVVIGFVGYDPPLLLSVEEGMPMSEAGFKAGDEIVKINNNSIHFERELRNYIQFHPFNGDPVKIVYKRDGEKNTTFVTPIETENGYRLGFGVGDIARVKTNPMGVMKYGFLEVKYWIVTTVESLKLLITGKVGLNDMAGPVGIVNMIGDTYEANKVDGLLIAVLSMFNISILLSANLGVMNLLPIPALDGGRLVFLIIEAFRGKPIDQEKEGMVHLIGMVALMLLMAVVMFNDIRRLL